MMVDRFSGPAVFARSRGKCEARQRCLELGIDIAIVIVNLVRW